MPWPSFAGLGREGSLAMGAGSSSVALTTFSGLADRGVVDGCADAFFRCIALAVGVGCVSSACTGDSSSTPSPSSCGVAAGTDSLLATRGVAVLICGGDSSSTSIPSSCEAVGGMDSLVTTRGVAEFAWSSDSSSSLSSSAREGSVREVSKVAARAAGCMPGVTGTTSVDPVDWVIVASLKTDNSSGASLASSITGETVLACLALLAALFAEEGALLCSGLSSSSSAAGAGRVTGVAMFLGPVLRWTEALRARGVIRLALRGVPWTGVLLLRAERGGGREACLAGLAPRAPKLKPNEA